MKAYNIVVCRGNEECAKNSHNRERRTEKKKTIQTFFIFSHKVCGKRRVCRISFFCKMKRQAT